MKYLKQDLYVLLYEQGAIKILFTLLILFGAGMASAIDLKINQKPPTIELSGDAGGRVDGTPWSSTELTGAVFIFMYVDPDEMKKNEHVEVALKEAAFPEAEFKSIAMINLAASWKPKFLIDTILKKKQKQYPKTTYVRDTDKLLVNAWGLLDQDYHVLAFDSEGQLIFSKGGTLTVEEIDTLIETIRLNISI